MSNAERRSVGVRMKSWRRVSAAVTICCLAGAGGAFAQAPPLPVDQSWRAQVIDGEARDYVYPRHVIVQGDASRVENPEGLRRPGGGATTVNATGEGTPKLVLDLGYNEGGKIQVGITKTDGTEVVLGYSEARAYLGAAGDGSGQGEDSGGSSTRTDTISGAGPQEWSSPGVRGAQRWIQLQLAEAGSVTIDYVRVEVTHYRPGARDYVGHFLSSDDLLNRVWYGSAHTYAVDAFRDLSVDGSQVVLTDGAKRDRQVWTGDLALGALTGYMSLREGTPIARRSMAMFMCQQSSNGAIPAASTPAKACPNDDPGDPASRPPSEGGLSSYTAWYIVAAYEYYLHSGDRDFLVKLMPVLRRAAAFLESHISPARGLYLTRPGDLNWHPPVDLAAGEDAHTNAAVHRALLNLAQLERWVGDGAGPAETYEKTAAGLRDAMLAHLWDSAAGAFKGNSFNSNNNHPQDAQVESVLAGVVSGEQARQALAHISNRLDTKYGPQIGEFDNDRFMSRYISPYISSWELLARFSVGDGAGALSLMRRLFGHMVSTDPASTMWEAVDPSGEPSGRIPGIGGNAASLSHVWSTGPVPALNKYVLGIRPAAPGYATWQISPQLVDLRWAQGQVPTPAGPIASRWQRGAADASFVLTVDAPTSTTGTVVVPVLGGDRMIRMDDQVVWDRGRRSPGVTAKASESGVAFEGIRGTHTFTWGLAPGARPPQRCTPRGVTQIAFRLKRATRLRSVKLTIGGRNSRRVRRSGRRLLVTADLRRTTVTSVRVRIVATGRDGRKQVLRRTLRMCPR